MDYCSAFTWFCSQCYFHINHSVFTSMKVSEIYLNYKQFQDEATSQKSILKLKINRVILIAPHVFSMTLPSNTTQTSLRFTITRLPKSTYINTENKACPGNIHQTNTAKFIKNCRILGYIQHSCNPWRCPSHPVPSLPWGIWNNLCLEKLTDTWQVLTSLKTWQVFTYRYTYRMLPRKLRIIYLLNSWFTSLSTISNIQKYQHTLDLIEADTWLL